MSYVWEETEKRTNKQTLDEFYEFFFQTTTFFLHCQFTTLVKYSRHTWSCCFLEILSAKSISWQEVGVASTGGVRRRLVNRLHMALHRGGGWG